MELVQHRCDRRSYLLVRYDTVNERRAAKKRRRLLQGKTDASGRGVAKPMPQDEGWLYRQ